MKSDDDGKPTMEFSRVVYFIKLPLEAGGNGSIRIYESDHIFEPYIVGF